MIVRLFKIGDCPCTASNCGHRWEGRCERGYETDGDVKGFPRPRPGGLKGPTPKHHGQDFCSHSRNGPKCKDPQDCWYQRTVSFADNTLQPFLPKRAVKYGNSFGPNPTIQINACWMCKQISGDGFHNQEVSVVIHLYENRVGGN